MLQENVCMAIKKAEYYTITILKIGLILINYNTDDDNTDYDTLVCY